MSPLDNISDTINPTATETEVPSYGLFKWFGKSIGKSLDPSRRDVLGLGAVGGALAPKPQNFGGGGGGGMFNWIKKKVMDDVVGSPLETPAPAPAPAQSGGGGGMYSWFKKKVMDDLQSNRTPQPAPQPAPAPAPAPEPQPASIAPVPAPAPQKSYRDFQWDDYNADRMTMDVDERDQYYDNYQRDRDFWGNYYNRQPFMPQPMQGPMRNPYGRLQRDRDQGMPIADPVERDYNMGIPRPIDHNETEYTYMPEDRSRFMPQPMPQRQGFFGQPVRREPTINYGSSFGGGGLRSLLDGLLNNRLGSSGYGPPRPRGGLGGLFGGFRPQPAPTPRKNFFGGLGSLFGRF